MSFWRTESCDRLLYVKGWNGKGNCVAVSLSKAHYFRAIQRRAFSTRNTESFKNSFVLVSNETERVPLVSFWLAWFSHLKVLGRMNIDCTGVKNYKHMLPCFHQAGVLSAAQTGRDLQTVHSFILCRPIKLHTKLATFTVWCPGANRPRCLLGNP